MTPADDRMRISGIYEESWKAAYRGILPQPYLDSIPAGRWAAGTDSPGRKNLLCIEDGKPVGTCSFGPSRFEGLPGWGEVISLYLLPAYMGRGCGKALLEAAVSALQKLGYGRIFLWVLEENHRARLFYEHFGFLPTEDFLEDCIGGKALREVRYIYSVP